MPPKQNKGPAAPPARTSRPGQPRSNRPGAPQAREYSQREKRQELAVQAVQVISQYDYTSSLTLAEGIVKSWEDYEVNLLVGIIPLIGAAVYVLIVCVVSFLGGRTLRTYRKETGCDGKQFYDVRKKARQGMVMRMVLGVLPVLGNLTGRLIWHRPLRQYLDGVKEEVGVDVGEK